jgi:hypothetical protein
MLWICMCISLSKDKILPEGIQHRFTKLFPQFRGLKIDTGYTSFIVDAGGTQKSCRFYRGVQDEGWNSGSILSELFWMKHGAENTRVLIPADKAPKQARSKTTFLLRKSGRPMDQNGLGSSRRGDSQLFQQVLSWYWADRWTARIKQSKFRTVAQGNF